MKLILNRLRLWAIDKLGGVDRVSCLKYAEEWLVAKKGETIISDAILSHAKLEHGASIIGERAILSDSVFSDTLSVAPWSRHIVLSHNLFLPIENGKALAVG
jgi:hypothetical protein